MQPRYNYTSHHSTADSRIDQARVISDATTPSRQQVAIPFQAQPAVSTSGA